MFKGIVIHKIFFFKNKDSVAASIHLFAMFFSLEPLLAFHCDQICLSHMLGSTISYRFLALTSRAGQEVKRTDFDYHITCHYVSSAYILHRILLG